MNHISTDYLKTQTVYLDNIIAIRQNMSRDNGVDHMKNGRNNNALVYFCSNGAHYMLSNGTCLDPKAGDAVYIPAGTKYKLKITEDKCNLFSIFFRAFDKNYEQSVLGDRILCTYAGNTQIPRLMNECSSLCDSTVGNGLLLSSYMYTILHEFVLCVEKEKFPPPVEATLAYINTNLNTVISVKKLASKCAMSESKFRTVFKESVGQSPLKYINSERMKKAAILLKESDLSVSMISDSLGFYDDAYFHKSFKKTYNCTPLEYREIKADKMHKIKY